VGDTTAGDDGCDAAPAQLTAVALVVVAAVADDPLGPSPRPAGQATHR